MKVTWKGEDGAPDAIELTHPETGKKFKFRAGKAVDVPNVWGSTLVLGNPYFEGDAPADTSAADDAKKADAIKAAEEDVAHAQSDLDTAPDDAKDAARKRLAAAQAKLDAAKKA